MGQLMDTYARLPVAFEHGSGCWLTDVEGHAYLDALSGIAVSTLGHDHPRLVAAIAGQAARVLHTSNLYEIPLQRRLAERLTSLSGLDEAFFCNSGCEANEAAIKLARRYGHQRGVAVPHIVVFSQAFHGRTMATLSATGNVAAQAGFEPLVEGFVRVPYNDLSAVRQAVDQNEQVVAVMLEMIQGEGGIRLADAEFQQDLRALCDAKELLLICDEVQCGIGRTGRWFGWQHAGVTPDVMTLAKGLGSGVPIGACLAGGRARGVLGRGTHGSTFGGNPLACAAALATLDVIADDALMANAEARGRQLRHELARRLADQSGVVEIRGQGLMTGIELDRPCAVLVKDALAARLLINVTSERVVRLLPPLIISETEIDELVDRLVPLIRAFLGG